MGVHTVDNKLVITKETKIFCFDLTKVKEGKGIKIFNSKQTIAQAPNIICIYKSFK